jgi:predicted dehydrogenase
MWSRFLPHYDVIHQAVHDGLIGEVTTVFADHGQHLYPDGPDRLAAPDLAGGALLDLAVYPISFADFVLGPLTTITATGSLTDRGVDQQESVTVANAAGALGVLHASMLAASPCSVTLRDRDGQFIDRYDPTDDTAHQGLRYEAAEAARCLTAGATESPLHPPATTLRIMQAMDEVRRQLGVHFPGE